MNSGCNIKEFILEKTIRSIKEMPRDVYALYFFINTNAGVTCVPTLSVLYNTLSELGESGVGAVETCWNIACWNTKEFPIIGNNVKDTEESERTIKMLSEWFTVNGYNGSEMTKDPLDDYFEYTVGYRVLSEIIEEIAPEVKKTTKNYFERDIVLLMGEYSYTPTDVKRITTINGTEADPFMEYYEEMLEETEPYNLKSVCANDSGEEDYDKIFSEFLEKVMKDFNR